jgi:hypothetical protein
MPGHTRVVRCWFDLVWFDFVARTLQLRLETTRRRRGRYGDDNGDDNGDSDSLGLAWLGLAWLGGHGLPMLPCLGSEGAPLDADADGFCA